MSESSNPPADGEDEIYFTPVPVRARRDGWTAERQRDFIRALRRIGSATTAARVVGKSRRGAYKLRERPGAESFAAAWDEALTRGFYTVQDHVIDRALNGAVVPRFYRGRRTGLVHRHYDGIAMAVLRGDGVDMAERVRRIEVRAQVEAYTDIERAWRGHLEELAAEQRRRMAAEGKLARLIRAGIIGPDWLDPAVISPPLPSRAPAVEAAPRELAGPRVRLL